MPKVYIRKAEYDYNILKPLVFELMDSIAGDLIKENSRVIIKPNLLAAAAPDMAVVTHPLIVKAAAEYVIDKGVRPQISDSPAVGSFEKILKESGIKDALEGKIYKSDSQIFILNLEKKYALGEPGVVVDMEEKEFG